MAYVKKGLELMYWELLNWVDPSYGFGWSMNYMHDPAVGIEHSFIMPRGEGATEIDLYSIYADSIASLTSAPWGVSSGSGVAYCPLDKDIYILRGGGYADFARVRLPGLTWTSLPAAPWAIGVWNASGAGPNVPMVHPCKGMATVPTISYVFEGVTYTTDHYAFAIRGGGTADFAMFDITGGRWVSRAALPWTVNRSALIWPMEWDSSRLICVRQEGTRDWAVYNIAANSWTSYTYAGWTTIPSDSRVPVYNKGFGGKHYIISAPHGHPCIDITLNRCVTMYLPRYWGTITVRWPRKCVEFVVLDGIPYLYAYAGWDRRNSFARCAMYNLMG